MSERVLPLLVGAGIGAAGLWGATRWFARRDGGKSQPGSEAAPMLASETAVPQREPKAGASPSPSLSPDDWDPIFATFAFGRGIPVPYLRELAWSESNMRADIKGGLFQITPIARKDYAERHAGKLGGLDLDLSNPLVNTAIAVDTLATIKASLAANHPRQIHASGDWRDPRFVELLTLAWNSGWSERGGVGKVLAFLDERGKFDATIDDIAAHAADAEAVAWLRDYPERYRWARGVAARFVTASAKAKP